MTENLNKKILATVWGSTLLIGAFRADFPKQGCHFRSMCIYVERSMQCAISVTRIGCGKLSVGAKT